VTGPLSSRLSLGLTLGTGQFRGSLLNTNTGKTISFQGVLLEKTGVGSGFFWVRAKAEK